VIVVATQWVRKFLAIDFEIVHLNNCELCEHCELEHRRVENTKLLKIILPFRAEGISSSIIGN
jgi:hypothetical protein